MQLTRISAGCGAGAFEMNIEGVSQGITVLFDRFSATRAAALLQEVLFGFDGGTGERQSGFRRGVIRYHSRGQEFEIDRSVESVEYHVTGIPRTASLPFCSPATSPLPCWVGPEEFAEILTLGCQEAEHFLRLSELCLNEAGRGGDDERSRIRRALAACHFERDGDAEHPGIAAQIAELRRKIATLRGQAAPRCVPAGPTEARLREIAEEIAQQEGHIRQIDDRLAELNRLIHTLETESPPAVEHDPVGLNRPAIESAVSRIQLRVQRWQKIAAEIAVDLQDAHEGEPAGETLVGELSAIQSVVARLEDRALTLRAADNEAVALLQTEIAALCGHVEAHARVHSGHCGYIESARLNHIQRDVEELLASLQQRQEQLRGLLGLATDVLPVRGSDDAGRECRHEIHNVVRSTRLTGRVAAAEQARARRKELHAERTLLVADRGHREITLHALRAMRDRLERELRRIPELSSIDLLQTEIAAAQARCETLQQRLTELNHAEQDLIELLDRVEDTVRCGILEQAGRHLKSLSGNGHADLVLSDDRSIIRIQTSESGRTCLFAELPPVTRLQTALALRLAWLNSRRNVDGPVPFFLRGDFFAALSETDAEASVKLLCQVADGGQQVLVFTAQQEVCELFRRFDADVRLLLPAPPATHTTTIVPAAAEPGKSSPRDEDFHSTKPVDQPPRVPAEPVVTRLKSRVIPRRVVRHGATVEPMAAAEPSHKKSNWLFYLEFDHSVDELARLESIEREALRRAGVTTVRDLLDSHPGDLDSRIRNGGFLIAGERLKSIRAQAEMACRVPMLRPADAALLVASGIRDCDALAQLRPEAIFERVTAFQKVSDGVAWRRRGALIDQQQAINWSRSAQYARGVDAARGSTSPFSVRERGRIVRVRRATPVQRGNASRRAPSVPITRQRPVPRAETRNNRAIREARRRRELHRALVAGRRRKETDNARRRKGIASGATALRFHLSRSSTIVEAPSIGPKTAEKLQAIGIFSVGDLLNQPAAQIADRLACRPLTPDVITQWQAQARLMCQVPELRGHDVQILVACGIDSPEDLLRYSPEELLRLVRPFAQSREGVRILRASTPPDLAEVSNWMNWARTAAAPRAA